jgi:hypothetical protein
MKQVCGRSGLSCWKDRSAPRFVSLSLCDTINKEVLGKVATEMSDAAAWRVIMGMFTSQSRARIVHLRSKLYNTRKGEQTCLVYYAQMKEFIDEMVATNKRLEDEEVICYILFGLQPIRQSIYR